MNYRADLDGMRGVAVLLVVLTHARFPVSNDGGTTGVTAFFVLSGYLITRLLLGEREATGRIDLRAFYLRRALRLGPALLLLLAFVAFVGVWVGWNGDWRTGIVASFLYVGNWVEVAGYSIDPLGHTWTLAIEEQFYLVWPAALILAGPRIAFRLAMVGVIVGAVAQLIAGGTFEYFSTITRGDAILAGCILGMVQPRVPKALGVAGIVLLVVLSYLNAPHDIASPAAIILSGLIVSSAIPELAALGPVGRRAYGIYLWNWPMTILFGSFGFMPTFLIAALSFRLLERPLSRRYGPSLHRTAFAKLEQPTAARAATILAPGPLPEQRGP